MGFGFLGCNPEQTWDSAADAPAVGTVAPVGDKEFVLVKAGAAITQYDCCIIRRTGEAMPATTTLADDSYPLCVPQVEIADDDYGWGLIKGAGKVNTDGAVANNSNLSTTAETGEVDDVDSAGRISGMQPTVAALAAADNVDMWCFHPRLDILA